MAGGAGFRGAVMEIESVAILGPGLLGGSLALDLSGRGGIGVRMWGRRQAALDQARAMGFDGHCTTDLAEAAAGAALVVLATPVGVMHDLAVRIAALADPPQLVTDMGSVKGMVEDEVAPVLTAAGIPFVGSHPMCGSERAGMEAAQRGLFAGAACVVVAGTDSSPAHVQAIESFWTALGGRVVRMDARSHDEAVARVSHLPHALAALLAGVATRDDPSVLELAARGFRDSTRVALGPPEMWCEILLENREAMLRALKAYAGGLEALGQALAANDAPAIRAMLEAGREARSRLAPDNQTRSPNP